MYHNMVDTSAGSIVESAHSHSVWNKFFGFIFTTTNGKLGIIIYCCLLCVVRDGSNCPKKKTEYVQPNPT